MEFMNCKNSKEGINNYYIKGSVSQDDKNLVLLGFKDSMPVLQSKYMFQIKASDIEKSVPGVKKILLLEVDPETGDKFINVKGKKLKMVPESTVPDQVKKTLHAQSLNGGKIPETLKDTLKMEGGKPMTTFSGTHVLSPSSENKSDTTNSDMIIKQCSIENSSIDNNTLKAVDVNKQTSSSSDMTNEETVGESDLPKPVMPYLAKQKMKMLANDVKNIKEHLNLKEGTYMAIKTQCEHCGSVKVKTHPTSKKYYKLQRTIGTCTENKTTVDKDMQTDKNNYSADSECQTENVEWSFPSFDRDFNLLEFVDCGVNSDVIVGENVNFGVGPKMDSVVKHISHSASERDVNVSKTNNVSKFEFFNDLKAALQPDTQGNLPIHASVLKNDLQQVKRNCIVLRARNETVNIGNQTDLTPLQLAVINKVDPDIVTVLLEYGAELSDVDTEGNNILHLAVESTQPKTLEILLQHATKCNFSLDECNYDGITPLMICSSSGKHEFAQLLLQYGAKPNERDKKSGRTALFHAAENHDYDMVQLLMANHADTKIRNFFGTSPHDAMFEVDDIPQKIKALILGKTSKSEKRKPPPDPEVKKKKLKTYPKYQKVDVVGLKPLPEQK